MPFDTFKCLSKMVYDLFFFLGKATIQARTIILEVARVLSAHKWRFAINVNFNGSTDSFFFQVRRIVIISNKEKLYFVMDFVTEFFD